MVFEMEPLRRIEEYYDTLTSAEKKAADYIISRSNAIIGENLTSLAANAGVSNAAVIRMARKLGYEGFSDFRLSLNRYFMSSQTESNTGLRNSLADTYANAVELTAECIDMDQVKELARRIWDARYLDVWGSNRSYQAVLQLTNRLSRIGVYNKPVSDPVIMIDDSSILRTGDMVILFTVRGRGDSSYQENLDSLRRKGCYTVIVTCAKDIELVHHADESFILPWISDRNKNTFLEDQMVFYTFIEILLMEVAETGNENRHNIQHENIRGPEYYK